jgi:hypothetical protein
MATRPNQHTAAQKFENTYGQIESPADLPYGPGSPDFMLRHQRFKRHGGPEFELPPGGNNSFWNQFFGLTPGQPGALEYQGPEAPPLRPNLGPTVKQDMASLRAPQQPSRAPPVTQPRPFGPEWNQEQWNLHMNDYIPQADTNRNLDINPGPHIQWPAPSKQLIPDDPNTSPWMRNTPPWGALPPDPLQELVTLMLKGASST